MSNIIRIKKNSNFVVMDKTPLNDKNLSWKAKGIIAFMLSKPDDWIFYIDEIITNSTDGEASFRSGFKELTDNGYVKRKPIRDGQRITRWETTVFENPLLCGFQDVENQDVENQEVENQDVENHDATKNELTKNDFTKDELTKNDEYIYTLFDHWNQQGIIKHKRLNQKMKSHTNARLGDYSVDDIKKSIDNYKEVLSSTEYYWTHKWTYEEFMKPNNVVRFLDEAEPLNNFKKGDKDGKGLRGHGNGYAGGSGKGASYEQAIRELESAERAFGR